MNVRTVYRRDWGSGHESRGEPLAAIVNSTRLAPLEALRAWALAAIVGPSSAASLDMLCGVGAPWTIARDPVQLSRGARTSTGCPPAALKACPRLRETRREPAVRAGEYLASDLSHTGMPGDDGSRQRETGGRSSQKTGPPWPQ